MGYRSNVAFAVSKYALPKLMAKLAGNEKALAMIFIESDLNADYQDGGLLAQWSCVKWHSAYSKVACVECFMNELDEEDEEEEYRFVRIGESPDDNEERGQMDGFCVYRTIDFY